MTTLVYCGDYQLLLQYFAHPEPVEGDTIHVSTGSARPVIFGRAVLEYPQPARNALMETPTRMIEFRGVTKRYGTLTAVNKVAFSIARGEYCALLGPNGAGKTTLVRMLLHFSVMSAGAITIDGLPVSDPHSRLAIGYLSEQPRIPAQLTGWEYLKRCAQLGGTGSSGIADDCARIVQVIGMQGCEHQKARTYSKGMVQRFCLGATLLGDPRLLILDEPTSGLDPIGIREVRVLLESLRNRGMTLLLNSHFLSEVEAICDTAAILHRGSLLVKDSISAIVKENETLEDVFVRVVSRC